MLVLGVVVGGIIGYSSSLAFKGKPAPPEFNIEAEGFRNITFVDNKINVEVVTRIDAENVKVEKNVQMPLGGFLKSFGAMEQLMNKLIENGVVDRNSGSNESTEEPAGE